MMKKKKKEKNKKKEKEKKKKKKKKMKKKMKKKLKKLIKTSFLALLKICKTDLIKLPMLLTKNVKTLILMSFMLMKMMNKFPLEEIL
jgi:hypothetical protein